MLLAMELPEIDDDREMKCILREAAYPIGPQPMSDLRHSQYGSSHGHKTHVHRMDFPFKSRTFESIGKSNSRSKYYKDCLTLDHCLQKTICVMSTKLWSQNMEKAYPWICMSKI